MQRPHHYSKPGTGERGCLKKKEKEKEGKVHNIKFKLRKPIKKAPVLSGGMLAEGVWMWEESNLIIISRGLSSARVFMLFSCQCLNYCKL